MLKLGLTLWLALWCVGLSPMTSQNTTMTSQNTTDKSTPSNGTEKNTTKPAATTTPKPAAQMKFVTYTMYYDQIYSTIVILTLFLVIPGVGAACAFLSHVWDKFHQDMYQFYLRGQNRTDKKSVAAMTQVGFVAPILFPLPPEMLLGKKRRNCTNTSDQKESRKETVDESMKVDPSLLTARDDTAAGRQSSRGSTLVTKVSSERGAAVKE